jgi:hypothetical protein
VLRQVVVAVRSIAVSVLNKGFGEIVGVEEVQAN